MSFSDDFTSEDIETMIKTLEEFGFSDFDETGMSISDVVPTPSQTQEEPRESHQDSSFLQPNETEMRFPRVSPMYIHCSLSQTPIYHDSNIATTTMNIGVEDYEIDITDTFGFRITNTHNTDSRSFQSVSASSSSLFQQQQQQRFISDDAFGQNQVASNIVNPFDPIYSQTPEQFQPSQSKNRYRNNAEDRHVAGSQIFPVTSQSSINRQQIQQLMGSESINSSSNFSAGVRPESGLHGHSQSQSQGHAQMSNSNLFTGNQSNFPPGYAWNMNSQRNSTGFVEAPNNNHRGGYGTNITDPEVCKVTNTQNNPASLQPASTTSSSLAHQQQQQFQQHGVLREPYSYWTQTKILKITDMSATLLIGKSFVENQILQNLPEEDREKILDNKAGIPVKVFDHDTNTTHDLCLAVRQQLYILRNGWSKEFVERRRLYQGEEIGLTWDTKDSTLHFSVLSRANP